MVRHYREPNETDLFIKSHLVFFSTDLQFLLRWILIQLVMFYL